MTCNNCGQLQSDGINKAGFLSQLFSNICCLAKGVLTSFDCWSISMSNWAAFQPCCCWWQWACAEVHMIMILRFRKKKHRVVLKRRLTEDQSQHLFCLTGYRVNNWGLWKIVRLGGFHKKATWWIKWINGEWVNMWSIKQLDDCLIQICFPVVQKGEKTTHSKRSCCQIVTNARFSTCFVLCSKITVKTGSKWLASYV